MGVVVVVDELVHNGTWLVWWFFSIKCSGRNVLVEMFCINVL